MIDFLVEPMTYEFMRRALLVVAASGIAGALLSCWLVHMGWSLMGDTVSHAVLPGVVIASMVDIPFVVGALLAAMVAVALIGGIREGGTVRVDAAMGIVFTALFSIGLVLIARFPSQQDLHTILFGSLLGMCLPFVLNRLGWDPATASAPLVTTLIDASGVLIYFSIATAILTGV